MSARKMYLPILYLTLVALLLIVACAPAAPTPTPVPTKPPAAAPTKAPAAPTKAAEPTKPAAVAAPVQPAASPTPRPATLKFGSVAAISQAGTFVAIEKGHFKEQGITLEVVNFRNVSEMIAPLGTGQLDVIAAPLSIPMLAAADRGVDLKLVASEGQGRRDFDSNWIVLRKDLADSGQVKKPADLKGMKVAIPSQGSSGDMYVHMMMEQAGLAQSDIEKMVLPFTDQAAAFKNKAIAASYSTEPFVAVGVEQGFTSKWIPVRQFFGDVVQHADIIYGSSLLKDQDLGRRWMIAYLKGSRDYLKALTSKQGRAELASILAKYTSVKDQALFEAMEMPYLDPNGMPDQKSTEAQYKWYVSQGIYKEKRTFEDITDLSFVEYAVQKLGRQ
ncbi:MAG: ABC transporter substrate-binding protein [Chloroflexi bacterium]|nr:ABC transporter substrate-binding protein [Chloroflexota bacterium]